jgi:N-acyl-D-aspartate/D-glutamate deacylase
MGLRAFEEEATEDDVKVMQAQLRDALRVGAVGFTTSRTPLHLTPDGDPVASLLATWDEVAALVEVLGEEKTGLFELAQGPDAQSEDPAVHGPYFARLRDLAVSTGVPITFGTLPVRPRFKALLACIDETIAAGGRMFGQSHSRGVSSVLSFRTELPFDRLPEWAAVRQLPLAEQRQALSDPEVRRRLIHVADGGDYGAVIGAEPRRPDYELLTVFDTPLPPHRTVGALAAERGVHPVELMIDLALASDFNQFFIQNFAKYHDEDIVEIMGQPGMVMTFSDSGAHVSQIMDTSIQTHLLGYWVRARQAFTLEQAVNMMTKRVADSWGFTDRGEIREGAIADINVFDPATVGPAMPTLEHDLPGGAKRLKQYATGFKATVVAGSVVLADGEHTGVLPGRLLRGHRGEVGAS